jgi:hypothetical protein
VIKGDLLDFIQSSFQSVWSLELLVFLRGHQARTFSEAELVRELRGSSPVVAQSLAVLQRAGLIAIDDAGNARYAPASASIEASSNAVAQAYIDRPSEVRRVILSTPNERLHSLADAFLVKKGKE